MKERRLPSDEICKSPKEFLEKMDLVHFDSNLSHALKNLSIEQLEELVQLLAEQNRKARYHRRNVGSTHRLDSI